MNIDILLGKTQEHLVSVQETKFLMHKMAVADFLRLQKDASHDGFDLQLASAFRDYGRQLHIWNLKARGERPLLDSAGIPLEFSKLSPKEIIFSILRWSALPGCSRHHWGTDIDIFDGKTQRREDVKLEPSECEGNGPAARLHEWLTRRIESNEAYGFYRCYRNDNGGVAPEPWHLSYYPMARRIADNLTFSLFKRNISESDILLKEEILENADEIFQRFVMNYDIP